METWRPEEIGTTAGKVWNFLHKRGESSLSAVERGVGAPKQLVCMAIGWLAREGKVALRQEKRSLQLCLTDGEGALESRIYRFGSRDAVLGPMLRAVRRASNVRILTHSTAVELVTDVARRRVVRARIVSDGKTRWVHARQVVLCGGAIENARLLLCSGDGRGALGNGSGWVGRCFMEHIEWDAGYLVFDRARLPADAFHRFQKIGRKGEVRYGYAAAVLVDPEKNEVQGGAEPRRSHAALPQR